MALRVAADFAPTFARQKRAARDRNTTKSNFNDLRDTHLLTPLEGVLEPIGCGGTITVTYPQSAKSTTLETH